MTAFLDTEMLAFDVESTGVDVETDRIVTATVVRANPSRKRADCTNWLVNPGVPIPDEAAAIHGISTEKAQSEGQDPKTAVKEVAEHIIDAWLDDVPVVAFNAAYDLTMLDREMRRHDLGSLPVGGPVIDPSVIDRALDQYRPGKRTLTDVCRHYGVTQDGAHSSEGDALAAARLAWKLPRVYEELRDADLQVVHDWQIKWRSDWAEGFRAYLKEQGRSEEVDGQWPIRAFVKELAHER